MLPGSGATGRPDLGRVASTAAFVIATAREAATGISVADHSVSCRTAVVRCGTERCCHPGRACDLYALMGVDHRSAK
jgi:hypothetical protein